MSSGGYLKLPSGHDLKIAPSQICTDPTKLTEEFSSVNRSHIQRHGFPVADKKKKKKILFYRNPETLKLIRKIVEIQRIADKQAKVDRRFVLGFPQHEV